MQEKIAIGGIFYIGWLITSSIIISIERENLKFTNRDVVTVFIPILPLLFNLYEKYLYLFSDMKSKNDSLIRYQEEKKILQEKKNIYIEKMYKADNNNKLDGYSVQSILDMAIYNESLIYAKNEILVYINIEDIKAIDMIFVRDLLKEYYYIILDKHECREAKKEVLKTLI